MAKEEGVKITTEPGAGGGIQIKPTTGEIEPPLREQFKEEAERGIEGEEEEIARKVTEKIPISSAIIKPPLRLEGNVLAEVTGCPLWMYTEEELEEITFLIQELGVMLTPQIQVVIALATMHGAKFTAWQIWKRTGRKGDLKKQTGEVEKKKVPEDEEVRV